MIYFKNYQICFWRKDRISDILPAIKCPSFKSETKIYKTSEMDEIEKCVYDQRYVKSIVIKNAGEEISIDLVYGDTVKITSKKYYNPSRTKIFAELKERCELWEIDDCACKLKKIRVWENDFGYLKNAIDKLKRISNINDAIFGMHIFLINYSGSFSKHDTMFFNHSSRRKSDSTKFIFRGDTLAVVRDKNYYNFRLDERTKESECSYISGRI